MKKKAPAKKDKKSAAKKQAPKRVSHRKIKINWSLRFLQITLALLWFGFFNLLEKIHSPWTSWVYEFRVSTHLPKFAIWLRQMLEQLPNFYPKISTITVDPQWQPHLLTAQNWLINTHAQLPWELIYWYSDYMIMAGALSFLFSAALIFSYQLLCIEPSRTLIDDRAPLARVIDYPTDQFNHFHDLFYVCMDNKAEIIVREFTHYGADLLSPDIYPISNSKDATSEKT